MDKALKILGYETVEQLHRAKALHRLGLTEQDMFNAKPHFISRAEAEKIRDAYSSFGYSKKLKNITGASEEQILRIKACTVLGTNEIEIDEDRSIRLSNSSNTGKKRKTKRKIMSSLKGKKRLSMRRKKNKTLK